MARHENRGRGQGGGGSCGRRPDSRGAGGGQGNAGGPPKSAESPEAPYHFVPIEPDLAVTDAPVFHNVQQTGGDFWSGELRCTLTALTPLLAGNYQFEYEHLAESVKQAFENLARDRGATGHVKQDKKVLEPLCLQALDQDRDRPGAVLIAGEALKGMVRGSLQALLSAPMERVQERTFSFRPNLMNDANIRPAIVHSVANSSGELTAMKVVLGNLCSDVIYVQGNAERALETFLRQPLANLRPAFPRAAVSGTVRNVKLDVRQVGTSRISETPAKASPM